MELINELQFALCGLLVQRLAAEVVCCETLRRRHMAVEANHDILEGPGGECLRGTCCAEVQFKSFATSRAGDLPIVCYAGAAKGAHSI